MRKYSVIAFVLASMLVLASTGLALEKTAGRIGDADRNDQWNAGTSCTVAYYNTCSGWVWIWSGWGPGEQVGVCFDACCGPTSTLTSNFIFAWTAAPSGYGFTGEIGVYDVDASCCPTGTALASQPFLPTSGWNQYLWNASVSGSYAIQVTHGPGTANPLAYASDHPAAGPTGPPAAGTCYPTTRPNHSFYWGTAASPICPGSTLNDGVLDAQLLWDAQHGNCPVSVEEETWGQIKSLYR